MDAQQDRITDAEVERIAAGLTKAQARVLDALRCGRTLGPGRDSRRFNANAAASLLKHGLVLGYAHGWCITSKGLSVAASLSRSSREG